MQIIWIQLLISTSPFEWMNGQEHEYWAAGKVSANFINF